MTTTRHPSFGVDHGPIGVTKNYADCGYGSRWSWKCRCGVFTQEGDTSRELARKEYQDHQQRRGEIIPCDGKDRREP